MWRVIDRQGEPFAAITSGHFHLRFEDPEEELTGGMPSRIIRLMPALAKNQVEGVRLYANKELFGVLIKNTTFT